MFVEQQYDRGLQHLLLTSGDHASDVQRFQSGLVPGPDAPARGSLPGLESYFASEPYAAPFEHASARLIQSVFARHGEAFDGHSTSDVQHTLVKWFVSRACETSRYALHATHAKSGLGYREWCAQFRVASQNPWPALATEFPVLVDLLAHIALQIDASITEVLSRLAADRAGLESTFGIPRAAKLTALVPNLSDPHREGRTVMRIAFVESCSIIYKPKPLGIEAAFNRFVAACDVDLGLKALNVLPCGDYGWVEDAGAPEVGADPLCNPESLGRAAACFWMLNATDLHFENVLPRADGLRALDLETLFAAPVERRALASSPNWREHSVSATLLFNASLGLNRPQQLQRGLDAGALSPVPNVRFELVDDRMLMRVLPAGTRQAASFPLAKSQQPETARRIVEAFRAAALGPQRRAIVSFVAGIEEDCALRLVLRDTLFYSRLLERIRQPRFLRDRAALAWDLESLHNGVHQGPSQRALHAIVDDEIRQLLRGDIPYFSYFADRRSLRLSNGELEGFFASTGKAESLAKVCELEVCDVEEQCALLSIALGIPPQDRPPGSPPTVHHDGPTTSIAREVAALARCIASSAFCPTTEPARWLSFFGEVTSQDITIAAGDRAFFGGSWGILVALQAVETALSLPELREFLDRQAESWSRFSPQASGSPAAARESLGFAGRGGEIFAQAVLLSLDPRRWAFLPQVIHGNLHASLVAIPRDTYFDVIGGAAGLALGCSQLLDLHVAPDTERSAREVLRLSALHLCSHALDFQGTMAWPAPKENVTLLSYAHGWSGAVTALAAASRFSDDAGERSVLDGHLERAARYPQLFLKQHGGWIDYRGSPSGGTPLNRSWCNGIPGFLRGLHAIGQERWSDEIRREVETLTALTHRTLGTGDAHRFCCGEMGIVDFLLDEQTAPSDRLIDAATASLVAANHAGRDTAELVFPGLFQGQAGIAYSATRLLMPNLPSLSGQLASERFIRSGGS